jgi:hypothetical protein
MAIRWPTRVIFSAPIKRGVQAPTGEDQRREFARAARISRVRESGKEYAGLDSFGCQFGNSHEDEDAVLTVGGRFATSAPLAVQAREAAALATAVITTCPQVPTLASARRGCFRHAARGLNGGVGIDVKDVSPPGAGAAFRGSGCGAGGVTPPHQPVSRSLGPSGTPSPPPGAPGPRASDACPSASRHIA